MCINPIPKNHRRGTNQIWNWFRTQSHCWLLLFLLLLLLLLVITTLLPKENSFLQANKDHHHTPSKITHLRRERYKTFSRAAHHIHKKFRALCCVFFAFVTHDQILRAIESLALLASYFHPFFRGQLFPDRSQGPGNHF